MRYTETKKIKGHMYQAQPNPRGEGKFDIHLIIDGAPCRLIEAQMVSMAFVKMFFDMWNKQEV